jgi:C-terminal processing protease CtpA/Prc
VKFFQPSSLGVEVATTRDGLCVTAATPGQPFARAGLRVDDLVTEVDGSEARTSLAFTQLLRKRLVQGGETRLTVRRQGKTIQLRLPRLR